MNIELLIDKNGNARPAPLFDQGLSLLFPCYGNLDCIRKFDVVEDKPVNNFIGSKSTEYNLSLIPREKIWEMIWKRWEKYAQICHQK